MEMRIKEKKNLKSNFVLYLLTFIGDIFYEYPSDSQWNSCHQTEHTIL